MANEKTSSNQAPLQHTMSRLAGTLRDVISKAADTARTRKTPKELFDDVADSVREAVQESRAVQQEVREERRAQLQARTEILTQLLIERKEMLQTRRQRRKEAVTESVEGAFVLAGRVLDADTGDGLASVRILVRERDPDQDDVLSETWTDELGFYRKVYYPEEFSAIFDEQAETYLHIVDPEGNVLFTSDRSFRHKADAVEIINAAVDGSKVPDSLARSRVEARTAEREIYTLDRHRKVLESRLPVRFKERPEQIKQDERKGQSE